LARRKAAAEAPESDKTIVLFLSLMILMLAFFIMMVSMSRVEEKKKEAVLESIYSTFGFLPGGSSPFFGSLGATPEKTPPLTPLASDFQEIRKLALNTPGSDKIELLSEPGVRTVIINRELLFEPESLELKPEAMSFLSGLAAIIQSSAYPVSVEGHTDDIPPQPGAPATNNWALSGLRALSVLKYLEASGVAGRRLSAFGYGPNRPLRPNTTAANRALNHRVEIRLDERAASRVEELKLLESPGQTRYKGFTFDIIERGGR